MSAETAAPAPRCPLCGSRATTLHARARDIEYCTSGTTYDIRVCAACDVLFVDPMLATRLDRIYPPNYYSFRPGRQNLVGTVKQALDRRALRRVTQDIPGERLAVLDIGGGSGWQIDQVRAADARFAAGTVVDIDAGARDAALAKGYDFFLGRFEDFAAEGRRFDLLLMLNLIEHVADPAAILGKAAGLLAPAGRIWVKTPNFDSLDARLFRHRSWAGYHTPRHFIIFNRRSLERLVAQNGLRVERFDYTQGAPFWSVSLLDELRRLGLASVSAERPAVDHPLTPALQALAAAFDFARKPFGARLSQMVLTLGPAEAPGPAE